MLYLKIINIFLKNNTCILKQIVQGTYWKWVDQVVFKLGIKTVKNIVLIITQEPLGVLKF